MFRTLLNAPRSRALAVLVACCALVTLPATATAASPGDLDPSFGNQGVGLFSFTSGGNAFNDVAVQRDGKILLAGYTGDVNTSKFLVVRLRPNGSLDPSFGRGGKVIKQFSANRSSANALTVLPNGRIVVGVTVADDTYNGTVAVRLLRDGRLDRRFGRHGKAVVPAHDPTTPDVPNVLAVTRQPDGKILLGGTDEDFHVNNFFMARLRPNGRLDSSFGSGGVIVENLAPSSRPTTAVTQLELQQSGDIVFGGFQGTESSGRLLAGRLHGSDGSFDTSFGDQGIVAYNPFNDDCGSSAGGGGLVLGADGHVTVAGFAAGWDNGACAGLFQQPGLVMRLQGTDGSFDPTFGDSGKVLESFGPGGTEFGPLESQPDGKLVVGGLTRDASRHDQFLVARLLSDGSLDSSFGNGGKVVRQFDAGAAPSSQVSALAIQSDGKLIAVGSAGSHALVTRLLG